MKKRTYPYNLSHVVSSIIMLLALAWLTVSTPFVYAAQQQQEVLAYGHDTEANDDFNPFASTNEEKTEGGNNTLQEEYLHHAHIIEHHYTTLVKYYKCHLADEYIAYHPEFFSPPPEV
jgi:hypothetical protein